MQNVGEDLKAIMSNGRYEFHPELTDGERCSGGIVVRFTLSSKLKGPQNNVENATSKADDFTRTPTLTKGSASSSQATEHNAAFEGTQYDGGRYPSPSVCDCAMKGPDLDDFVRKLGFLQTDSGSGDQVDLAKRFLRKDVLYRQVSNLCLQLYLSNHPQLHDCTADMAFPVSLSEPEIQGLVTRYTNDLENWKLCVANLRERYPKLLCFSLFTLSQLGKAMESGNVSNASELVSGLFENSENAMALLKNAVARFSKSQPPPESGTRPHYLEVVGALVVSLMEDDQLKHLCLPDQLLSTSLRNRANSGHTVHLAYGFSSEQVLRLVVQIYHGLPQSFEFLLCNSLTTKDELDLFLRRPSAFERRTFVLVEVNTMNTELQEHLYGYQLKETKAENLSVHYVVTGRLAFQEAPWINIKAYKEADLISQQRAEEICNAAVGRRCGFEAIELVCGRAGDGKSHYIRKELKSSRGPICTIAVHEGFSEPSVIEKLKVVNGSRYSRIFFNVTIPPPCLGEDVTAGTECNEYHNVVMKLNWFLFKLIGLGFVHDDRASNSLRIRSGCQWKVYVEVPSLQRDYSGHESLQLFQRAAPFVSYVGKEKRISPKLSLDLDDDTQLVCKYLRAYHAGNLNRTYSNVKKKPVSIASDPPVPSEECEALLREYMPPDVRERKLTQHLFVQYMNRRCSALESCHDFQYNQGKVRQGIDTRKFGSVLMKAMLKEVSRFCAPNTNTDLSYQQLVYDSSGGSTTFHFLSLNPSELKDPDRQELITLGLKVPDETDLNDRRKLDFYLSKGLKVDLEVAPPLSPEDDSDLKSCSNPIDNEGYVLTADFAMKMLAIHERRLCGTSVVIEGDTGVGKTKLLQMLSVLWNTFLERSRQLARERIVVMLEQKAFNEFDPEIAEAAVKVGDSIGKGCDPPPCPEDVRKVCNAWYEQVFRVLLDPDTVKYDVPAPYFVNLNANAAREWGTVEGATGLLTAILSASTWKTFHKCYIHSGLTPDDITRFLDPLFKLANKIANQAKVLGGDIVPAVVIFFDEINTSSCVGIMKELLIDRTLNGDDIPSNVFLVAACNPYRDTKQPHLETEQWTRGVYRVRQLPPSIQFLLWDYGSLSQQQEGAYVTEKIRMVAGGDVGLDILRRKDLICRAQEVVREFAFEQLQRDGVDYEDCRKRSRSFVSQRDIQRVFDLANFLERFYQKACVSSSEKFELTGSADKGIHATIVSLGIVYYLRLDKICRKRFAEAIDGMMAGTTGEGFRKTFEGEIQSFVQRLHIPKGVAMTKALAENLFAIVLCTARRIPLIVIGPPGSSKTLSFKLALSILRGDRYRTSLLRDTDLFPYLDLYHYQCSRRTTTKEIDHVFRRAIDQQLHHQKVGWDYNSVVFMDEVGLPTDKDDSLKALHQHLDDQCVAFVGITNRELDPSKSNRAINVYRLETDEEDLKTLARACLRKSTENRNVDLESFLPTVEKLSPAYVELMKDEQFRNFFGLRDFMHMIHYIRRNCDSTTGISPNLILRALERNFSGVGKCQFRRVLQVFMTKVGVTPDSETLSQRGVVAILNESLKDQSLIDSVDSDSVEAEVRFKLIIDEGEDDSLLELLFESRVLNEKETCVFTCSDFLGDAEVQKINVISDIRQAAEEGKTVILSQTEDINESFYDLFNQSFKCLDHPQQGKIFFASIAIGPHSKLCRVDPRFQCILHIRSRRLGKPEIPCPLLNRFEKFRVCQEDILTMILEQRHLIGLKEMFLTAIDKVRDFETVFGRDKFYGATCDTVTSVFLDILVQNTDSDSSSTGNSDAAWPKNPATEQEEDDQDHSADEAQWDECAPQVVANLEMVLRKVVSLHLPRKDLSGQTLQAQSIFGAVKQLLDKCDFNNCRAELIGDPTLIQNWFVSARDVLCDTERYHGQNEVLRNTTFVVATFVQLLVFHGSSRILQLAIPEAVIAQHRRLPNHFFSLYLEQQTHFSLAELFEKARLALVDQPPQLTRNKLICFTKTTSFIHSLPSRYPVDSSLQHVNTGSGEAQPAMMRLLQKTDISCAVLLKLDQSKTFDVLNNFLLAFIGSESLQICILLANMEICSKQRINVVRHVIKKLERTSRRQGNKLFVLLLHFPPSLGHTHPCYPSHFLQNWDQFYLDSVVEKEEKDALDICPWIRASIESESETIREDFVQVLEESLVALFTS